MSIQKTIADLHSHKEQTTASLTAYLESLIDSNDPKLQGKADKLSYWITDWVKFLDFEPQFSPKSLRRYKRGEIIKVHLGFNIGSEEGGLHYAVVIEKNNPKTSPVVNIIPLTSVKSSTDITHLHNGSIFLGNELFTSLNAKISATDKHLTDEMTLLKELVNGLTNSSPVEQRLSASSRISKCEEELAFLTRMRKEVLKMKQGSIALVNQITTVSKIRIYNPKTDYDILSNIKLSNEKLDLLDAEIIKRYTNCVL